VIREGAVEANGLKFAYLEQGDGPLVLLLHGYPDNAWTWEHQLPALAEAGYRAVAPFLRGYPPTEIPDGGFFDMATLAVDARDLIRALGDGGPAHVVGNDWGAYMVYALGQAFPDMVGRAVATAVPHQAAAVEILSMPELIHHTFHVWFHQVPFLPEQAIAANDFAFVEYLWRLWEPGFDDPEHVSRVRRTLAEPGALSAALGYYRAVLDPDRADPALAEVRARFADPIGVSTMLIFGRDDPFARFGPNHADFVSKEFRLELVDGGQHFVHRSRPAIVNELIVSWLRA
jgi:pimeloyl-ACP methyl ester carboxylesterase